MTKIAVLGMGRMGQAATVALLNAGHDVYVWNRTLGRTWDVVEAGAHAPADLAATVEPAEIVLTVLSDDDAVRTVVLGDDGVKAVLEDRLYVDASTVSPELSDELADSIERYVAMPIAGAPDALREGKATCLVGAGGELIEEAKPLINALSAASHHYASPRHAVVAKITNNLLLLVGLAGLTESIAVGRAGGLTDGQLHELLESSAMVAPGVRNRLDAVLAGEGPTWWTVNLGTKDARLALAVGSRSEAPLPVAEAASERYEAAAAKDLGDQDIALIGRLYGEPSNDERSTSI